MQMIRLIAIGGLVLATTPVHSDTLVHAGRLIDGAAERAVNDVTIRVSGNTIAGVERGYTTPAGDDTVIDLRKSGVRAGL